MSATAGLHCGFGEFLGADTLQSVKAQGFAVVRIDCQAQDNARTAQLAQEVIDAGLQPLVIVRRAEQMRVLPEGALVEAGNEPDIARFGWSVNAYVQHAHECVAVAIETGQRLYVGVVSNLNKRGFRFLESLPWNAWPFSVCCSVHRYPTGDSPRTPHGGCRNREDEIKKLREIVGTRRPVAVTEIGYSDGPDHWSENEVAAHLAWERQLFDAHGFELVVGYQINDGARDSREPDDHYGFRRLDGDWKPVARHFIEAV